MSSIRTNDSHRTKVRKVEHFISKYKELIKKAYLGRNTLRDIHMDVRDIERKLNDEDFDRELRQLCRIRRKITARLDELDDREQERRALPKAALPVFDTNDVSTYLNFKNKCRKTLVYGNDHLNTATLLASIKGPRREELLSYVRHAETPEEIFAIFDRKMGDIDSSQLDMLDKLSSLQEARNEKEENHNILQIINYMNLAKKFHRLDQFVDKRFIWQHANLLRPLSRKEILNRRIYNPLEFKEFLMSLSEANDISLKTRRRAQGPRDPGNKPGQGAGAGGGRGGQGAPPGGQHRSHQHGTIVGKPRNCLICKKKDSHSTFMCYNLKNMSKEDVEKLNLCAKCLGRSDSTWHSDKGCAEHTKKFVCKQHNLHYGICKCEKPKSSIQNCTLRVLKPKFQKSSTLSLPKGDFFDRIVLFFSETAHIKTKDGYVPVTVNYDSYATDSSIHESLQEHLMEIHDEGSVEVQQFGNILKQPNTKTGLAKLKEVKEAIRLMINQNPPQKLEQQEARVPKRWQEKYGLKHQFASTAGIVKLVLGQDNAHLFPRRVDSQGKLVLSKSCLTGKFIVGGKFEENMDEEEVPSPPAVPATNEETEVIQEEVEQIDFPCTPGDVRELDSTPLGCGRSANHSPKEEDEPEAKKTPDGNQTIQHRTEVIKNAETDEILKAINSDTLEVNVLKRCAKCLGCETCRKSYLPEEEKNLALTRELSKNVSYDEVEKRYTVKYPYNKNLKNLPSYQKEVHRMAVHLEKILIRSGRLSEFDAQVQDFFDRNVLKIVEQLPEGKHSFIPLTYALRDEGSTMLRVCGNSSFTAQNQPSLNQSICPGPNNLSNLVSCLLKFRSAYGCILGDIRKMLCCQSLFWRYNRPGAGDSCVSHVYCNTHEE